MEDTKEQKSGGLANTTGGAAGLANRDGEVCVTVLGAASLLGSATTTELLNTLGAHPLRKEIVLRLVDIDRAGLEALRGEFGQESGALAGGKHCSSALTVTFHCCDNHTALASIIHATSIGVLCFSFESEVAQRVLRECAQVFDQTLVLSSLPSASSDPFHELVSTFHTTVLAHRSRWIAGASPLSCLSDAAVLLARPELLPGTVFEAHCVAEVRRWFAPFEMDGEGWVEQLNTIQEEGALGTTFITPDNYANFVAEADGSDPPLSAHAYAYDYSTGRYAMATFRSPLSCAVLKRTNELGPLDERNSHFHFAEYMGSSWWIVMILLKALSFFVFAVLGLFFIRRFLVFLASNLSHPFFGATATSSPPISLRVSVSAIPPDYVAATSSSIEFRQLCLDASMPELCGGIYGSYAVIAAALVSHVLDEHERSEGVAKGRAEQRGPGGPGGPGGAVREGVITPGLLCGRQLPSVLREMGAIVEVAREDAGWWSLAV